ncbi:MAG: glycine cleavage system protein R [bacterium]
MSRAVISTIGHDRPGLVSDITALASALALNIEDSRMTVLGGEFAVLMALQGAPEQLAQFQQQLDELCAGNNLAYIYRETQTRQSNPRVRPYVATIVALDHPGIVYAVAQFFSARQINIRDMHTDTRPAAHTGTPIFSVSLVAEVPADVRVHSLKAEFEAFCEDADLDGHLEAQR